MKKKLFLLAFCAIFSIVHCLAQEVESVQTNRKSLKEGKNLLKSTPTMKVYAEVQNKQVTSIYVMDNTGKNEVEMEQVQVLAAPGAPGEGTEIDMPPMCIDCLCIKKDKRGNCTKRKCKSRKCSTTPH